MKRYEWDKLNHLQVGRYAEYFVKMEVTMYGFDVYTSEVDDKGIDFIIRKNADTYFDIQVKAVRNSNYIFFRKGKFKIKDNLYAAVVLLSQQKAPRLYLIPSTVWNNPNVVFVSKDYEGKKSVPEYGINISKKNVSILEEYRFDKVLENL